MDYLKYEIDAGPDDIIEVTLDNAANVQLMNQENFTNYDNYRDYRYHGGYVQQSPFRISPPHQGHWFLVIDLGGGAGSVRAEAKIFKRAG